MTKRVLIVEDDPSRPGLSYEWLRVHDLDLLEVRSWIEAASNAEHEKPDLMLLRLSLGVELFHKWAPLSDRSGAFIAVFLERSISEKVRKEVLELRADGFINEDQPADEKLATIHALIRKKHIVEELKAKAGLTPDTAVESKAALAPLRDRAPGLYQEVLRRYEEGVKLVLQNRIYKMNDDIFEPFRQIARELFQADATARDVVELHYQTLRKIAPSLDAPRAQAYLEVGRTTIIGLMGDLITCYRDTNRTQGAAVKGYLNGSSEFLKKQD